MTPRLRLWLVSAGGLASILLGSAAFVVHRLAPTRWPEATIRWSPSVEQVLHAGAVKLVSEVSADLSAARAIVERFPAAVIEREVARGGARARRAVLFLVIKASADPAARTALDRLIDAKDPFVRQHLAYDLQAAPRVPDPAPLIARLIVDADPIVVMAALGDAAGIAAAPGAERLRPTLVAALETPPRPSVTVTNERDLLLGRGPVIARPETAAEADETARAIRVGAWRTLAVIDPAATRQLAEERCPTAEELRGIAAALRLGGARGIPWLHELACRPDAATAELAVASLGGLAQDGHPPAWIALLQSPRHADGLALDRRQGLRITRNMLAIASAEETAAIVAALTEDDRATLAAPPEIPVPPSPTR